MTHECGRDLIWLSIEPNPIRRTGEIVTERCLECRRLLHIAFVLEEPAPIEDDGA